MVDDIYKEGDCINAYNEIIGMIRQEGAYFNTPSTYMGVVVSGFPDVKIRTLDVVLDKDNLMVDSWLKTRAEKLMTEETLCPPSTEKHKHEIKEPIYELLNPGDEVVLVRQGELFIIISKVVKL